MGQFDRMIMEMDEYSRGRGMYDMKLTMGGIWENRRMGFIKTSTD
jgi:hypothetical protein